MGPFLAPWDRNDVLLLLVKTDLFRESERSIPSHDTFFKVPALLNL